jgi:hypothetical protein
MINLRKPILNKTGHELDEFSRNEYKIRENSDNSCPIRPFSCKIELHLGFC